MAEQNIDGMDVDDAYQYQSVYIDRLEIENFKSYRGFHQIGPFKPFTAVIGPNGSGKSNLMDAISFVLGVKSAQLRGGLKDLLYVNTSSNDPADAPKRGYVKLILVSAAGEETELSRWLQPGTGGNVVSVYKVNGQQVNTDAYNRKLASYGILVKVKNFLVFQGDIEAVAQKSPMELTKLFEQISGSEALVGRYEECKAEKEEAESRLQLMFSKKKNIAAEKKAKKEQKEEAERYLAMQRDLKDARAQLMRFFLKCLHKDISTTQAAYEKEEADIAALEQQHQEFDAKVAEKKKSQAEVTRKRLRREKDRQTMSTQLDKKGPELRALEMEVNNSDKRLKLERATLEGFANEDVKARKKVAKLQADLDRIKAELVEVDREAADGEDNLSLSTSALDEYNSIKTEVQARTTTLQTELRRKEDHLEELKVELSRLKEQAKTSITDKKTAEDTLKEMHQELNQKKAELADLVQELEERNRVLTEVQDQHRKIGARRTDLQTKLDVAVKKLDELKQDRRENTRDKRLSQAVENLKQNFPGVAGRMTELGKMPDSTYRLAITLAMQQHLDSVVVDTVETSMECIKHLNKTGGPRINFIPLSRLKDKPIDERLRQLGGSAKLAFDLVRFDRKYERAFMFALGNSVVCDDATEGRRLAFDGASRVKVITKEGVLYSTSGAITGGISGSLENTARKWSEQEYQEVKQRVDSIQQELLALPEMLTMTTQRKELEQQVQTRNTDKAEVERQATRLEHRIPIVQNNLKRATEAEKLYATKEQPLQKSIAEAEKAIVDIQKDIAEVADEMFKDFSRKLGIANIREYEEKSLKQAESLRKRRRALEEQDTKLQNQIKFETTKMEKNQTSVQQKTKRVEELEAKIQQQQDKLTQLQQEKTRLEDDIEKAQEDIRAFREEEKEVEASLKELKDQEKEYLSVIGKHKRQLGTYGNQLKNACRDAWRIFEEAAAEQIPVINQEANGADEAGPSEGTATEEQTAPAVGSFEDYTGLEAVEQANKALEIMQQVDFDLLPRQHQNVKGRGEKEKVVEHYETKIADLKATLEKNAPNLKAVEQFQQILEKEKKQSQELEAARAAANEATKAFDQVHQTRLDKFNSAFEDISKSIDEIYKQLTTSRVHPMGGQAFLSLENPEEPFSSGIKYTAMPPTKRFRDMESLSGGEKTMAAVALLFAIHRYRPSPFFVLDEVDAALDATNVSRLAHYIRNNTRNEDEEGHQFQSIVISLKDNFFEKADALVGVSRDAVKGCSHIYSIDLERFGEPTAVDS